METLYLDNPTTLFPKPEAMLAAHKTTGTFLQGTVRFSFGFFNSEKDIGTEAGAVRDLMQKRNVF